MLSRRSTVWSTVLVMVSVVLSLFASAAPAGAAGPTVVYDLDPDAAAGQLPQPRLRGQRDQWLRGRRPARRRPSDTQHRHRWHEHVGAHHRRALLHEPGPWTDPTGWSHPFTVTLYRVSGPASAPVLGSVIATRTQTQKVPWRPTHTTACPGNTWSPLGNGDATSCFNGFAFSLDFDFSASPVALPDRVAVAMAYSTQHYGPNQITGSGPYNSLNVGWAGTGAVKGTDVNTIGVFYDHGAGLAFGPSAAGQRADVPHHRYRP